jgi:biopolymer transport protein ExbD
MKKLIIIGIVLLIVSPVLYFVLATKTKKPETIIVNAPSSEPNKRNSEADTIINVLLLNNGKVICYTTELNDKKMSFEELRNYLIQQKELKKNLTVKLKPIVKANFKMVVDALDQMQIAGIRNYAVEEPADEERRFAEKLVENF